MSRAIVVSRDGTSTDVTLSAADDDALASAAAVAAAREAKQQNNSDRVQLLCKRAARYAKDPVANASDDFFPTVTGTGAVANKRLICELLARLGIATASDDQ